MNFVSRGASVRKSPEQQNGGAFTRHPPACIGIQGRARLAGQQPIK